MVPAFILKPLLLWRERDGIWNQRTNECIHTWIASEWKHVRTYGYTVHI
jgi:hypothetical protein